MKNRGYSNPSASSGQWEFYSKEEKQGKSVLEKALNSR